MQSTYKTTLSATLQQLVAQREHWEHGVYKQANAELYAILEGDVPAGVETLKKGGVASPEP